MHFRTLALLGLAVMTTLGLGGCNSTGPKKGETATTATSESQPAPIEQTATITAHQAEAPKSAGQPAVTVQPETAAVPPQPPKDLWRRIRNGYGMTPRDNARIDRELKWYAKHNEYLKRVRDRAAPYLHFIVEEAEKRHLPLELTLLPIVESGFQPFAYSPGRAAGIWQFIPSTGKHYGLKQNWWYDGRRDIVSSTRAALDYLQASAKQFNGDWELALAAYNAGAGNVSRAIKRNKKLGKPTDFWSLKLPPETRSYVPRLLAIARIVADPQAYGIELPPVENRPVFESVDIGSQLDLALAAEMAGISIEELYRLNAGFNRWASAPDGPHRLNLPVDRIERFNKRLAQLPPEQRLSWKRYKIRSGDSLGGIARRHHTTVALIKQVNKIKGSRIRAGKHLLIPVSTKTLKHYALSADQRHKQLMNRSRKGVKLTHTVRPGDSLWSISRSYGVHYKHLAQWNGMAPGDTLHIGQKLVIWSKQEKIQLASLPTRGLSPMQRQSTLRYTVRRGDSLARIAQRFNVRVSDLRRWNSLPGKYLQPGQKLKLHVDVTEQARL